ncbi:hypothetical protein IWX64_003357 [Arthrobacter sp. CAN_A212]|uniref:hypothetical protein n=1 Tax=Arthrobacter sp. CAN_A212 TaxID=2787719 RepID=UPI0018C9E44A
MVIRRPAGCITLLLLAGMMSGCTSTPGSVEVEVRAVAPDFEQVSYEIQIVGPDQEMILAEEMSTGHSVVIGDIPLGTVTVTAVSLCTVEAELTSELPTMSLIIDGNSCTLAD